MDRVVLPARPQDKPHSAGTAHRDSAKGASETRCPRQRGLKRFGRGEVNRDSRQAGPVLAKPSPGARPGVMSHCTLLFAQPSAHARPGVVSSLELFSRSRRPEQDPVYFRTENRDPGDGGASTKGKRTECYRLSPNLRRTISRLRLAARLEGLFLRARS